MKAKCKLILTFSVTSAVFFSSFVGIGNAQFTQVDLDEFNKYRIEAVEQELSLQSGSLMSDEMTLQNIEQIVESGSLDDRTVENIKKTLSSEVTIMNFDEKGNLVSAISSENGDVLGNFESEIKDVSIENHTEFSNITQQGDDTLNLLGIIPDNPTPPPGSDSGAFHRIVSPTSSLSTSYTGGVADDVRLPDYDVYKASMYGEAGYLYTGIDENRNGIVEVGFGTYKGTQGIGWFPLFHAKGTSTDLGSGTTTSKGKYYYDFRKSYSGGAVINGYKVFYKTDYPTLTITYQLNWSNLYVIKMEGRNSQNKAIKRVTAIAMPISNDRKTPFNVSYTSYANWGNYRFLTNNGSNTVYPTAIPSTIDTWSHGGKIDYNKQVYSTTDRDEQYRIYR
ncbi:hypothetical protein [Paenibacillus alvei]|uniref:hypothetical protein n=1 Tax=Paenibacillus alvei TaxID=44250 RepID=UPI0013DA8F1B|nr:hypothetical protein [Paenibacillus alvei]NEZ45445.1 hypothetical protein [Paenibacillus alvei]